MRLIEVWSNDGKIPSLLVSNNWVINGAWEGIFDKENNKVFIKYTKETVPYFYLGDCENLGEYQETFKALENGTIKILGKNLIKYEKVVKSQEIDEPAF
jgi:hypothetical protein